MDKQQWIILKSFLVFFLCLFLVGGILYIFVCSVINTPRREYNQYLVTK